MSVDVSAGRLVYAPVSAGVGTNNLLGSVRYDTAHDAWVYGSAATPLGSTDTLWGAVGIGGRFVSRGSGDRRATFGADVGAHGFSFRDAVVDRIGTGGILEAMPFARFSAGLGFIEGRGGWRGHTLSAAGVRNSRGVFETGARAGYGGIVRIEGDAHWVRAPEGTYPFAGATFSYNGTPVQIWGQTGKWLRTDLDDVTWGGGLAVTLGARSTAWASVRQEAPDPLYWNTARRTWSVGITQRLGRVASPLRPAPRSQTGDVVVTLRVEDAPQGGVSIAGDFNGWQPVPMRRDGNTWVARLTLAPGAYHYAFRSAAGEWFVPSSTPGRRDDGMGGDVAVLMVT